MTLTDCSNGFHFFELWHIHLFLRVYYFIHLAASLPVPACLSGLLELRGARGTRGDMSPLAFGKLVNPTLNQGGGRICPPRYYCTPLEISDLRRPCICFIAYMASLLPTNWDV